MTFASATEKNHFLDLVRSADDLGSCYIESDLLTRTIDEITDARPLASVLPDDVMTHVTFVAATVYAETSDGLSN